MKTLQAVGYTREALGTAVAGQPSLEMQHAAIRQAAKRRGLLVDYIYHDKAHEIALGPTLRPQLWEMLRAAARHEFQVVITSDPSRLASWSDHASRVYRVLKHHRVKLVSSDIDINVDTLMVFGLQNHIYEHVVAARVSPPMTSAENLADVDEFTESTNSMARCSWAEFKAHRPSDAPIYPGCGDWCRGS